ncbi:MAG: hypothetical protein N3A58_05210 [Spirochaetes bacterium]|nr:hypothetical protein [Spirochaetota bacterium]
MPLSLLNLDREPTYLNYSKETIKDLMLDKTFENIIYDKKYEYIKEYYFKPLNDLEYIEYRKNIFSDIIRLKLKEKIIKFNVNIEKSLSYFNFSQNLHYNNFKKIFFLKSALIYCNEIIEFANYINNFEFNSIGLINLKNYLNNYIENEGFKKFSKYAFDLENEIKSIKFILIIDYGKITVKKYKSYPPYKDKIFKTFNNFICKDNNISEIKILGDNFILTNTNVNHIEENILKLVFKLYPQIFSKLNNFSENYFNFFDSTLINISQEIPFYYLYIEIIEKLKNKNLSFSIPELNKKNKIEKIINSFDINLAINSINKENKIVLNSYYLENNKNVILISGQNGSGKTTFARMIGQVHYLASLGLPVPGEYAYIFIPDSIYTHFEKEENVIDIKSKLENDLYRTKDIICKLSNKSLIILNEIFSSTTYFDAQILINKILNILDKIDCVSIWVSFVINPFIYNQKVISMVSQVNESNPGIKTFKIIINEPKEKAYANFITKNYNLTFEDILKRFNSKI